MSIRKRLGLPPRAHTNQQRVVPKFNSVRLTPPHGIDKLPVELLVAILSLLHPIDFFSLKLAGSRLILSVIRTHFASLSFEEYVRLLEAETLQRWPRGPRSVLDLAAARGQMGLVAALFDHISPHFQVKGVRREVWLSSPSWKEKILRKRKTCDVLCLGSPCHKNALHWSAEYGQDDILQYLIMMGADPATCMVQKDYNRVEDSANAAHLAAANGHASTVRLLLFGHNVPLCSGKCRDYELLETAARYGHDEVVRVILLYIHSQKRGRRSQYSPYPAYFANAVASAAKHGHVSTIRLLAAAESAWRNAATKERFTAALYSDSMGDKQGPEGVLSYYKNFARRSLLQKKNLLDLALANGHEDVAKLLTQYYAPNPPPIDPTTASFAAGRGYEGCVRMALGFRAPLWGGEGYDYSSNVYSDLKNCEDNGQALGLGHFPAIHEAAGNGHASIVSLLLENGDKPNRFTRQCYTPLHLAACCYPPDERAVSIAEILVNAGAGLGGDRTDSPLHFAAKRGNHRLVQYLIDQGAPVNLDTRVPRSSDTPLHLAAANTHCQVIEILLDAGAAIDARTYDDSTPLHFAACNEQLEAYFLLLDRGADPTLRNKHGKTALEERERCAPSFLNHLRLRPAARPPPRVVRGDYPFRESLDPPRDFREVWSASCCRTCLPPNDRYAAKHDSSSIVWGT